MDNPVKTRKKRAPSPKGIARKKQICQYIDQFTADNGYPPSVREIGDAVGLKSPSTVQRYIVILQKDGILRKNDGKTRTITTTKPGIGIPIVGKVTAGQPILAFEDDCGRLAYRTGTNTKDFALRVRGDSMVGAGILDGDFVVVRQQDSADNGAIVVALLEDEATVKRFQRKGSEVWLYPENPNYEPISAESCTIVGRVIAVIRQY